MRISTALLMAGLVVLASASSYLYYQVTVLQEAYSRLRSEIEGATYIVDLMVDYGNGTKTWYNGTIIGAGWSLYNLTTHLLPVRATYNKEFDAFFVEAISGVGLEKPASQKTWYWIAWRWDETDRRWIPLEVGSNLHVLRNGEVAAWVYQDTSSWPPEPPS